MGRVVLQMMMSLDGMVSGPDGKLDWTTEDEASEKDHLERLKQAELIIVGAGVIPEMSDFWTNAEDDESADETTRNIGRGMNETRKIIYSHEDLTVNWRNSEVHVAPNDDAFVKDIEQVRAETSGTIIVYGGVRMARSFLEYNLADEIHLDICPIILGDGKSLFSELTHRNKLTLLEAATYDSGTVMVRYKVAR